MLVDIYHGTAAFVALVTPFLAFIYTAAPVYGDLCQWHMKYVCQQVRVQTMSLLLIWLTISSATSESYRAFTVVYVLCFLFVCFVLFCLILRFYVFA